MGENLKSLEDGIDISEALKPGYTGQIILLDLEKNGFIPKMKILNIRYSRYLDYIFFRNI